MHTILIVLGVCVGCFLIFGVMLWWDDHQYVKQLKKSEMVERMLSQF
jgi:uncharacterized protein YggT (Ycf19 family)